ncbi:helix-turn-helix transcriptional regulator [Stenomitos frigidus]|nr:LuxR C-terminal-related transcriptional regulator [Stenomitos frigidus]
MKYLESLDNLLQSVLESFIDGVLVLTDQHDLVYANTVARAIYAQLWHNDTDPLPREIQRIYQALLDSKNLYPNQPVVLESEIVTPKTTFRIRAQWLALEVASRPCLLLRLQDQNQSVQSLALAEAQKWGLTPRETEVWLQRRSGYSRKAIAANLYIALDTVKKHLKNIHLKQQALNAEAEWQASQAS